jgi:hypothetical protein
MRQSYKYVLEVYVSLQISEPNSADITFFLAFRRLLQMSTSTPQKLRRKLFPTSKIQKQDTLSSIESWDYRGNVMCLLCNVRPCVTGHPAWRDAVDTLQHNKRNNGVEVYRLLE